MSCVDFFNGECVPCRNSSNNHCKNSYKQYKMACQDVKSCEKVKLKNLNLEDLAYLTLEYQQKAQIAYDCYMGRLYHQENCIYYLCNDAGHQHQINKSYKKFYNCSILIDSIREKMKKENDKLYDIEKRRNIELQQLNKRIFELQEQEHDINHQALLINQIKTIIDN